jgi:hypothetical protein
MAASLVPMGIASAQSPAVSVAVPSPGGGGGGGNAAGCYRLTNQIYGPYRMSFCLNRGRGGSYQVTGGGLNCKGRLDWYQNGNRVNVDLYRAPCGRGTDWTGDSLSCRTQGNIPLLGGGVTIAVPAPSIPVPGFNTLGCTYNPVAGGYRPVSVTARRV